MYMHMGKEIAQLKTFLNQYILAILEQRYEQRLRKMSSGNLHI